MQLSLEVEIDQFRLEQEERVVERPALDFETEPDRLSVAHLLELTIANVNANSKEEKKNKAWI